MEDEELVNNEVGPMLELELDAELEVELEEKLFEVVVGSELELEVVLDDVPVRMSGKSEQ
jgi:hypothetical protein